MLPYALTGWLVAGALPMGGVGSAALAWVLPLIAVLMLVLLALLAADTRRTLLAERHARLGGGKLGGPRQAATFHVVRCASTT